MKLVGAETLFIAPGSPWENAYIESFNSRFRDELLSGELFPTLAEARYLAERHRSEYNQDRPHGSLGMLTPDEFSARWKSGGIGKRSPRILSSSNGFKRSEALS